jgi:acyl dehydratase
MLADMTARTIDGPDALKALVGEHLGYSDWAEVTQEQINLFADATGDHQWIHTDVARAEKESPFGGPIAHGYLTLSLIAGLAPQILRPRGFTLAVNYGCNRVRFPSPVPAGAKIRLGAKLLGVEDIAGGVQPTIEFTVECEGAGKPSCIAEVLFRYYT